MQCVEFETRLNDLLDDRFVPSIDTALVEHAQRCARCSDMLAAHDALLDGVGALPALQLGDAARQSLAHRVAVEVGSSHVGSAHAGSAHAGSAPAEPFPIDRESRGQVELAGGRPAAVAANSKSSLALIGIAVATAAAVLIAILPWFRSNNHLPSVDKHLIVAPNTDHRPLETPEPVLALRGYEDLAPIARVGYQVADGLTPVTNSMVTALRELRKRPFFRNADEQGRSSFYSPQSSDCLVA